MKPLRLVINQSKSITIACFIPSDYSKPSTFTRLMSSTREFGILLSLMMEQQFKFSDKYTV